MSQHSPFPWSQGESFVLDADGQAICREYSHNLNWKDDRALIAAIPEMVASLSDTMLHLEFAKSGFGSAEFDNDWLTKRDEIVASARAILKKVKP